jgi:nucleotide-binding universal stress UspA family protein
MKRILIATEGSDAAAQALESGLELADEHGAQVWLLHVQPPNTLVIGSYLAPAVSRAPEHVPTPEEDEVLQHATAVAAEHGIAATPVERIGPAAEEIVALADQVDADLIVVGSRGLGALGRAVLGSTSRAVLAKSRRPVLVVRPNKVAVPA